MFGLISAMTQDQPGPFHLRFSADFLGFLAVRSRLTIPDDQPLQSSYQRWEHGTEEELLLK